MTKQLSKGARLIGVLAAATSVGFLTCQPSWAEAVIDNGTIQLGINDNGTLIVPSQIGLTFLPSGGEALAPGCDCEGWGIIDFSNPTNAFGVSQSNGGINEANGTASLVFSGTGTDAASVGDSAISTVAITMGGLPWATVTQNFHPSASPFLYEDTVTILNTGTTAIGNLGFRRAMDWDVPPTEFNEYVTISGLPNPVVVHSSDDGFHSLDMNDSLIGSGISPGTEDQNFTDSGPEDHGAAFDFSFGTLPRGASKEFQIFYGAAGNPADALTALTTVGAEVYSLGMPSNFAPGDAAFGTPNTFIFAFKGLSSPIIGGAPVQVSILGQIRQFGSATARNYSSDMRMDGLSAGGEHQVFGDADVSGWHPFASVGYDSGNFKALASTKNDFHIGSLTLGADYTWATMDSTWANNYRAGVALNLSNGKSSGGVGTTGDQFESIDATGNFSVTAFGGFRFSDHGYADLAGTIGFLNFNTHRRFVTDLYDGSVGDTQYDVRLRGGYDFPIGQPAPNHTMSVGPLAVVEYTDGTIDAFTERSHTDPSGAIVYSRANYQSWTSQLGGRFNWARMSGDSHTYGVTLKAAWEHQFEDSITPPVVNSVSSLPSLAPYGADNQDRLRVGGRVYLTSPSNSFTVALEDEFATGRTHDNAITARIRIRI